jgi:DNA polymerase
MTAVRRSPRTSATKALRRRTTSVGAEVAVPKRKRPTRAVPLAELRAEAAGCRACELYANATQTVFGRGPRDAEIMLVGEQPGDAEDREGRPFVGPSGRLLRAACEEAGLDFDRLYVTNAVKHFRWKPSPTGKRRLHATPEAKHVQACSHWLAAELRAVAPKLVVCLGATAARALFGRPMRIRENENLVLTAPQGFATVLLPHPSALLRIPDVDAREAARKRYVASLSGLSAIVDALDREGP